MLILLRMKTGCTHLRFLAILVNLRFLTLDIFHGVGYSTRWPRLRWYSYWFVRLIQWFLPFKHFLVPRLIKVWLLLVPHRRSLVLLWSKEILLIWWNVGFLEILFIQLIIVIIRHFDDV